MEISEIESFINKIPDHPKPGILFYDVSSLISHKDAFKASIDLLTELTKNYDFELIAAIDARGFIFASAIAYKLEKGIVMVRKEGKLPGKKISYEYKLEYGNDTLEVNIDLRSKKILLVDDLLATGGTANAAVRLIEKSGGLVTCFLSLIELDFLNGRKKLGVPIETLINYYND
jgi:adenine phosphoribosyltransferase